MPPNFGFISTLQKLQLKNAYIVGGTVRDMLIGKNPVDVDIVVSDDTEGIAKALADIIRGTTFFLDKKRGILRVISSEASPPNYYDISPLKGGNIFADLSLRDFTIDALAIPLAEIESIIDPYNGMEDIRKGCIKVISRKSFEDDSLRMLRAFRLAITLGFSIDRNTLNLITELAPTLRISARERIRDDFFKILSSANSVHHLYIMHESSLLREILSGMDESEIRKGLRICGKLEDLYTEMHNLFAPDHVVIKDYFLTKIEDGITNFELWKWISLYIDSSVIEKGFRIAAESLRLGNKAVKIATLMFKHRDHHILDKGIKDKKSVYRFFKNNGDNGIGLIFCSLASSEVDSKEYETALMNSRDVMSWYFHTYKRIRSNLLITGNDIIRLFNIPPGPLIRSLLDLTEENQVLGNLATKEDAVSFLKKVVTNF